MKFINDVGVRNDKVVYIRISNNDYSIVEDISTKGCGSFSTSGTTISGIDGLR